MADDQVRPDPDDPKTGDEPMTDAQEGSGGATPPHPSPADGGGEAAERPPRPSQAEGER